MHAPMKDHRKSRQHFVPSGAGLRALLGRSFIGMFEVCQLYVVVFFTLTDRASTIHSNIGTWSQRGTEVNGSHHGDNPLLRPTLCDSIGEPF